MACLRCHEVQIFPPHLGVLSDDVLGPGGGVCPPQPRPHLVLNHTQLSAELTAVHYQSGAVSCQLFTVREEMSASQLSAVH